MNIESNIALMTKICRILHPSIDIPNDIPAWDIMKMSHKSPKMHAITRPFLADKRSKTIGLKITHTSLQSMYVSFLKSCHKNTDITVYLEDLK